MQVIENIIVIGFRGKAELKNLKSDNGTQNVT